MEKATSGTDRKTTFGTVQRGKKKRPIVRKEKTTFGTETDKGRRKGRSPEKRPLVRGEKEKTTFGTGKTTSGTGFMIVKQLYFTGVKTTFGTAFAGKSVPNDIFPYYILYMVSRNKTSFFAKKEASFQKKTERCPLKVGKIKTPSCRFQKWEEFFRRVWWR